MNRVSKIQQDKIKLKEYIDKKIYELVSAGTVIVKSAPLRGQSLIQAKDAESLLDLKGELDAKGFETYIMDGLTLLIYGNLSELSELLKIHQDKIIPYKILGRK